MTGASRFSGWSKLMGDLKKGLAQAVKIGLAIIGLGISTGISIAAASAIIVLTGRLLGYDL